MRHGSGNNNRRQRNRGGSSNNHRRGGAPNRSQVFDSNGPDVRIRGTAHQIVEKYIALAKDARSSGDQSLAENYLQHAEHYQRIISAWDAEARERESAREFDNTDEHDSHEDDIPHRAEGKSLRAPRKPVNPPAATKEEDLGLPASILVEARVGQETV